MKHFPHKKTVHALFATLALAAFTACDNSSTQNVGKGVPAEISSDAAHQKCQFQLSISETRTSIVVAGTGFSASFSKGEGALDTLTFGGKNLIVSGAGPKLDAFRAIINNDAWAYRKWFQAGLFDMTHKVVEAPTVVKNSNGTVVLSFVVQSRGKNAGKLVGDSHFQRGNPVNGVPVKIELGRELGENDFTFTTHQIWTVYPDGSVELEANITSNNPSFDLPRLGYALDVPAAFSDFTFYGRGPQENYSDRKSGAFVGLYKSTVAAQVADYEKPQETGNHEGVRWCALTDATGAGVIFIAADDTFSAQALPVKATDLLLASNRYKLDEKIAGSKATTLRLDAGVRGLGGASCGPDTEKRDKVFAVPTDFGFIIRPVPAGGDLRALANVSASGAMPISITRDAAGVVSVSSKEADAEILVSVNGAPAQKYTAPIPFKNGGTISATYASVPSIKTQFSFAKIEKVKTSVHFASSENGGREAAVNLTDGDASTIWHTAYSVTQADFPHWVDFDMGEIKKIRGVSYLPRHDGGSNGDVKAYEIFVSLDGKTWGEPVAKGEFSSGKDEKKVIFDAPVDARYVRFRALSAQDGSIYAAGSEFSILEN